MFEKLISLVIFSLIFNYANKIICSRFGFETPLPVVYQGTKVAAWWLRGRERTRLVRLVRHTSSPQPLCCCSCQYCPFKQLAQAPVACGQWQKRAHCLGAAASGLALPSGYCELRPEKWHPGASGPWEHFLSALSTLPVHTIWVPSTFVWKIARCEA